MIDTALLSDTRRWHFPVEIPIREIERWTALSRNTIRKDLRSAVVEPKFKVPNRPSNLDPFADRVAAWLRMEAERQRDAQTSGRGTFVPLAFAPGEAFQFD